MRKAFYSFETVFVVIFLEEVFKLFASHGIRFGHRSQQLHHLRQMIISLPIVRSLPRLKQKVSRYQFEQHARKAPQIRGCIIVNPQHDFRSPILPGLYPLGKMEMRPAPIPQVAYLHIHILVYKGTSLMGLLIGLLLIGLIILIPLLLLFLLAFLLKTHLLENEIVLQL